MKIILFICLLLSLAKSINTFCVYNDLTENSYVIAKQEIRDIPLPRHFIARLNEGDKQCCHFSNRDCSPNGVNSDIINFEIIVIHGSLLNITNYHVKCTTGGGLVIYNNGDERLASCTLADGNTVVTTLSMLG